MYHHHQPPKKRSSINTAKSNSSTMKLAVFAATVASAAAFAPAGVVSSSSTLSAFANGLVGGEGPEPMPFTTTKTSKNFDPAGFAERAPDWVPWFREAELKHSRAAMLACAGFVVPELFRIPGAQFSFDAIPKVIDAHDALPESMIQIFGWISFLEAVSFPALANMNGFDRKPGNFGFDPLGLFPTDPAKQKEMELSELKNGRLAMIAIGGMVTGAAVTGHGFPYL
jgi:light-harvesting complex I chlorophyll a/b binding protein 4